MIPVVGATGTRDNARPSEVLVPASPGKTTWPSRPCPSSRKSVSEAQLALERAARRPCCRRMELVEGRAADECDDGCRGHAPAPGYINSRARRPSVRPFGFALNSATMGLGPISTVGPGDLSTTIEADRALRLAGEDPEAEHMRQVADSSAPKVGSSRARVFTHVWLALFGLWPCSRYRLAAGSFCCRPGAA